MRFRVVLLTAALAFAACAQQTTAPGAAAPKSTATLLDTYWKLTQLGDQVITTAEGVREVHFVLESQNQRMRGFSGCNTMTGRFVLNGDALKFDQVASTMMACTQTMELERDFNNMIAQVARWKISGETLQLRNADGKIIATFESRYMK